jgi:hypothetical protein
MPRINKKTVTRSLAAGLAVCAIAPGTALAMPATDGAPAPASDAAGVTAQDYRSLDYRAPDEATGQRGLPVPPAGPIWPANPQPITRPHPVATADPSTDSGVDTGVWVALGAAGLALAGGIGVAGRKRLGTGRQGQLA